MLYPEDYEDTAPQPGSRFWGWTLAGWLVLIALICAGLTCCHMAFGASMSASAANGDTITLYEDKFEIASAWFAEWRKATFFYEGKMYEACWRVQAGGVLLIDAAGDISAVPLRAFKRNEAI